MKATGIRFSDENFRRQMMNPPKQHTKASAMASTFVNDNTMKKATTGADNAKSIFKMKKFLAVEPRTSSKNTNYKAPKRASTAMGRTATRPNPVLGGK